MQNDERITNPNDKDYFRQPEKYALARFAYYECFKCSTPYFGGKKECENQRDMNMGDFKKEELVCTQCAAKDMKDATGATNCKTHGTEFIEYKCKFCCNIG